MHSQDEGWAVEFEIGHDDDGKVTAVSVTAPGGGPCSGPRKNRRPRDRRDGNGARSGGNRITRGPAKPKEPFWHDVLSSGVKSALQEKGIRTSTGTLDVSVGDARVKLGTRGYSSMAHAGGIIAEGTFTCEADGNANFTWDHCITFDSASGQWISTADKAAQLLASLSLSDGMLFSRRVCFASNSKY